MLLAEEVQVNSRYEFYGDGDLHLEHGVAIGFVRTTKGYQVLFAVYLTGLDKHCIYIVSPENLFELDECHCGSCWAADNIALADVCRQELDECGAVYLRHLHEDQEEESVN